MIYFDNAATTKISTEVHEAMMPYLGEIFGNPSSTYHAGQKAHVALNGARKQIASFLNAKTEEIIFTSGATESIATAVLGLARAHKQRGDHIITSKAEHKATLDSCKQLEKEGFEVTYLTPDREGLITKEAVINALRENTILVSLMHANNETGLITPIDEIGSCLHERKVLFHVDATASYLYVGADVQKLHCHALSLSAHKFEGPKGSGLLYLEQNTAFEPLIPGAQEFHKRGGTQNVAAAVGLAKAMELVESNRAQWTNEVTLLRDYLSKELMTLIADTKSNATFEFCIPSILNIFIEGSSAETLVMRLDLDDIAISKGSACSSSEASASHVLTSMGYSEERAVSSIRISLSHNSTREEIDTFIAQLAYHVGQIRHMNITY